jgi:hypothetical protein
MITAMFSGPKILHCRVSIPLHITGCGNPFEWRTYCHFIVSIQQLLECELALKRATVLAFHFCRLALRTAPSSPY